MLINGMYVVDDGALDGGPSFGYRIWYLAAMPLAILFGNECEVTYARYERCVLYVECNIKRLSNEPIHITVSDFQIMDRGETLAVGSISSDNVIVNRHLRRVAIGPHRIATKPSAINMYVIWKFLQKVDKNGDTVDTTDMLTYSNRTYPALQYVDGAQVTPVFNRDRFGGDA